MHPWCEIYLIQNVAKLSSGLFFRQVIVVTQPHMFIIFILRPGMVLGFKPKPFEYHPSMLITTTTSLHLTQN